MKIIQFLITITAAFLGLDKEVCYHSYGIGCFSNRGQFDNAKHYVPESPAKIRATYFLYTRESPTPTKISANNIASFNGTKKTKFIIHGYKNTGFYDWVQKMKNELLKRGDMNVIVVNWAAGADTAIYEQAAANIRVVAALLAKLVTSLYMGGANYEDMHLIGHSLGAHLAGYVGERVHGIGRITGLDPAGPAFGEEHPHVRLDLSDALFVDVIHTDAERVVFSAGLRQPIGHVDFYPNGGKKQPGCTDKNELLLDVMKLKNGFRSYIRKSGCSHRRAYHYFIESINSGCHFRSYPCESCRSCRHGCAYMGYDADTNRPRGMFYLATRASPRFCKF